jgi:hypothetical protein
MDLVRKNTIALVKEVQTMVFSQLLSYTETKRPMDIVREEVRRFMNMENVAPELVVQKQSYKPGTENTIGRIVNTWPEDRPRPSPCTRLGFIVIENTNAPIGKNGKRKNATMSEHAVTEDDFRASNGEMQIDRIYYGEQIIKSNAQLILTSYDSELENAIGKKVAEIQEVIDAADARRDKELKQVVDKMKDKIVDYLMAEYVERKKEIEAQNIEMAKKLSGGGRGAKMVAQPIGWNLGKLVSTPTERSRLFRHTLEVARQSLDKKWDKMHSAMSLRLIESRLEDFESRLSNPNRLEDIERRLILETELATDRLRRARELYSIGPLVHNLSMGNLPPDKSTHTEGIVKLIEDMEKYRTETAILSSLTRIHNQLRPPPPVIPKLEVVSEPFNRILIWRAKFGNPAGDPDDCSEIETRLIQVTQRMIIRLGRANIARPVIEDAIRELCVGNLPEVCSADPDAIAFTRNLPSEGSKNKKQK